MTLVAAAIPAFTSAITIAVGRPFKCRIQPSAFKAYADKGSSSQQGNKAQHNQDHGPVHNTSPIVLAAYLAQECGPVVAPRRRGIV